MARRSILAAATALAFSVLAVNATPCRPSSTVTSSATAVVSSSTAVAETSSSTTLAETSSTAIVETSTTTLAETSTTSEAPVCTVTQAIVNPSFDDGDGSPWTGLSRSEESPRTGRYNLRYSFDSWTDPAVISQTLTNLEGDYEFTFYYRAVSWVPLPGTSYASFFCELKPKFGNTQLPGVFFTDSDPNPYTWTKGRALWTNPSGTGTVDELKVSLSILCGGEMDETIIALDDVAFTRVCDGTPV